MEENMQINEPVNTGQINELTEEIEKLKAENLSMKKQVLLDKAGCIKSELVSKAIPDDCEDIEGWIDEFKSANEILFKPQSFGSAFKPARANILNPKELMNNYIRNSRRI